MRVKILKKWFSKNILLEKYMSAYTYINTDKGQLLKRVVFNESLLYGGKYNVKLKKDTIKVHIDNVVPQVIDVYVRNLFVLYRDPITKYIVKMDLDKLLNYIYKSVNESQIYSSESDFNPIVFQGVLTTEFYFKVKDLINRLNYVDYYIESDLEKLNIYLNPKPIKDPIKYLIDNIVYGVEPRLSESELSGYKYVDNSHNKSSGYYIVNDIVYYIEFTNPSILIQYSDRTFILANDSINFNRYQKALCFSLFCRNYADMPRIFFNNDKDLELYKDLSLKLYSHMYPLSTD